MAVQEYCVGAATSSSTAFVKKSSPTSNKANSATKVSQGMEISELQLALYLHTLQCPCPVEKRILQLHFLTFPACF